MRVRVLPYDPEWPRAFEREAKRLGNALGAVVARLHHIGSTAIPGIAAKPVIDILIEVSSVDALDERTAAMEARDGTSGRTMRREQERIRCTPSDPATPRFSGISRSATT